MKHFTLADYFRPRTPFPAFTLLLVIGITAMIDFFIFTGGYIYHLGSFTLTTYMLMGGVIVLAAIILLIAYLINEQSNVRPGDRIIDDELLQNREIFTNDLNQKTAAMTVDSPLFIFPIESLFVDATMFGFLGVKKRRGVDLVMRYSTVNHRVMALMNNRIRTISFYADLLTGQSSSVIEDTLLVGIERISLTEATVQGVKQSKLLLMGPTLPQPIVIDLTTPGLDFAIIDRFMKSITH